MHKLIIAISALTMVGCASLESGRSDKLNSINGLSFEMSSGQEIISEYSKQSNTIIKDQDSLPLCISQNKGEITYVGKNSISITSKNRSRYTLPTFSQSYENIVEYTLYIKLDDGKARLYATNITRGLPGYGQFRLKTSSDYRPDLAIESIDNQMNAILKCASIQ